MAEDGPEWSLILFYVLIRYYKNRNNDLFEKDDDAIYFKHIHYSYHDIQGLVQRIVTAVLPHHHNKHQIIYMCILVSSYQLFYLKK